MRDAEDNQQLDERQSSLERDIAFLRGSVKYLETYILYVHKQYTSDEAVENPQRYALTV